MLESVLINQILGGTMRFRPQLCHLKAAQRFAELYGKDDIVERHRHRYEVNNTLISKLTYCRLIFAGLSTDNKLVEIVEVPSYLGMLVFSSIDSLLQTLVTAIHYSRVSLLQLRSIRNSIHKLSTTV